VEDDEWEIMPDPSRSQWSGGLCIAPREGVDIVEGDHLKSEKTKQTVIQIQLGQYAGALSSLQHGVDVVLFFQPCSPIRGLLIEFLWYVWNQDHGFFDTILERIAYSAGESWVRQFKEVFRRNRPPETHSTEPHWPKAEAAGRFFDWGRPWYNDKSFSPTALQLCCAAGNCSVAAYLIGVGFRPQAGEEYKHPVLFARISGNVEMENLLSAWMDIPPDIFTVALLSLFSCSEDSIYWCDGKTPTRMYLNAAMTVFLRHGANVSATVWYLYKYVPLLHAAIYALHSNEKKPSTLQKMLGRLIESGADVDELAEALWSKAGMSPLALASALDERTIFKTLLLQGAKVFWWGLELVPWGVPVDFVIRGDVIAHLTAWLPPPSDPIARELLKGVCVAVLPSRDWVKTLVPLRRRVRESFEPRGQWRIIGTASFKSRDRSRLEERQSLFAEEVTGLGKWHLQELEQDIDQMNQGAGVHGNAMIMAMGMARYLRRHDFREALRYVRAVADVAFTFLPRASIPLQTTISFMWYLANEDAPLLKVILDRMAFATQTSWISLLRICICLHKPASFEDVKASGGPALEHSSMDVLCPAFWKDVYRAASIKHSLCSSPDTVQYSRTALQIAAAADNYAVVEYLVRSGYTCGLGPESPTVISALTQSITSLPLLISTYASPRTVATEAIRALLADRLSSEPNENPLLLRISHEGLRSDRSALEIMRILLEAGGDASSSVLLEGGPHPLLHAVMDRKRTEISAEMVQLLLKHGADPDSTCPLTRSDFYLHMGVTASALVLATLLMRDDIVSILLGCGARMFWVSHSEILDHVPYSYHSCIDSSFSKAVSEILKVKILVGRHHAERFEQTVSKWRDESRSVVHRSAAISNWI
jgi:hypothetical protein